jgi:hypothetical protein
MPHAARRRRGTVQTDTVKSARKQNLSDAPKAQGDHSGAAERARLQRARGRRPPATFLIYDATNPAPHDSKKIFAAPGKKEPRVGVGAR